MEHIWKDIIERLENEASEAENESENEVHRESSFEAYGKKQGLEVAVAIIKEELKKSCAHPYKFVSISHNDEESDYCTLCDRYI